MSYDKNNIFAKILRGEIPCKKVYENDHVLSFYDVNPQKKIHVLVIPKGEYNIDVNSSIVKWLGRTPVKSHDGDISILEGSFSPIKSDFGSSVPTVCSSLRWLNIKKLNDKNDNQWKPSNKNKTVVF